LGRCTAELHLALASSDRNAAFRPEPLSRQDLERFLEALRSSAQRTCELLRANLSRLPAEVIADAERLVQKENLLISRLQRIEFPVNPVSKIRIHGDYHLGQVLRVRNDYVIIDFEGEPGRPLAERREKASPLKDVAGMLRSFSYAAQSALINYTNRRSDQHGRLSGCARFWEAETAALFLKSYRERAEGAVFLPRDRADVEQLLDVYLLDKALYELRYEINNRPAWVHIPLAALSRMLEET
jgi:maltose alpha-D-glucosyltransferase/alpha-amylase